MVKNHTHILGAQSVKSPKCRPKVAKQPRLAPNRGGRAAAGAESAEPLRAEARCCIGAVKRLPSEIKNEALH